ncbi:MAG: DUF1344 domain-containing protein [Defluviimonas sp.]|uniref:DUF1344 domain-containing protein n=1 Tax=Albidovulum sp. TaxID=1872424 RepID=UPI001DDCB7AC|nr:DUF1344 domain-containing protein [Paracoccaceae bacterium]MCC0063783.1 DUF1344 domain-containing protein [Defluviimonas sp.]
MRSYLSIPVLAVSLAVAGMAYASTTSTGEIKAIDMSAHTITLADGMVYYLPAGFKDPGLKVGEKVSVVWDMKNNEHQASEVTIAK